MKMNAYYDSSFGQETSKTASRNHWEKQIKKKGSGQNIIRKIFLCSMLLTGFNFYFESFLLPFLYSFFLYVMIQNKALSSIL